MTLRGTFVLTFVLAAVAGLAVLLPAPPVAHAAADCGTSPGPGMGLGPDAPRRANT